MAKTVKLYNAGGYTGGDIRGMTIAAMTVVMSAGREWLPEKWMQRRILRLQASPSAISYWLNTKSWLEQSEDKKLLRLTSSGRRICHNALRGATDTPTSQQSVDGWIDEMLNGGPRMNGSGEFELPF
jgi:hypothetical protein